MRIVATIVGKVGGINVRRGDGFIAISLAIN